MARQEGGGRSWLPAFEKLSAFEIASHLKEELSGIRHLDGTATMKDHWLHSTARSTL